MGAEHNKNNKFREQGAVAGDRGALLSLVLALYVPELRELFHFSVLHFEDLMVALVAGVLSVGWVKVVKGGMK